MIIDKTTTGAPMDNTTNHHDHQPILLCRSDILPPNETANPSSFSGITEIPDGSCEYNQKATPLYQYKRKWDDSAQENTRKVTIHENFIDSPVGDDVKSQECHYQPISSIGKKFGRKPLADDDPSDDDDPKVKRKAQNRAAQRAFRERREHYVKNLEYKLKQVQDAHTMTTHHMFHVNNHLRSIVYHLETENTALKGIHLQNGSASGKLVQEWLDNLHHQQQEPFTTNTGFASVPRTVTATGATSVYTHDTQQHLQELLCLSHMVPQHPLDLLTNVSSTPSSNQQQPKQQQQQQPQKYTFSVSTPATLRSRHKKQHRSSVSPPPTPKLQRAPVEMVRLYSHEQSTNEQPIIPPPSSVTVESPNSHSSSLSPPLSSSTRISSGAQTPTTLDNQVQNDGYDDTFDLLLSSEAFFNSSGTLDESLDFHRLNEHLHVQHGNKSAASPLSCSSPLFDTIDDCDSSTTITSAHDIWNELDQGTFFGRHSSDQLLK